MVQHRKKLELANSHAENPLETHLFNNSLKNK